MELVGAVGGDAPDPAAGVGVELPGAGTRFPGSTGVDLARGGRGSCAGQRASSCAQTAATVTQLAPPPERHSAIAAAAAAVRVLVLGLEPQWPEGLPRARPRQLLVEVAMILQSVGPLRRELVRAVCSAEAWEFSP